MKLCRWGMRPAYHKRGSNHDTNRVDGTTATENVAETSRELKPQCAADQEADTARVEMMAVQPYKHV